MKKKEKLFIVRKYIMATSASHALKIENKVHADECWLDDDWKKNPTKELGSAIGYSITEKQDE